MTRTFVPAGYQSIKEWLDAEVERRGPQDGADDLQMRLEAFQDLANFLGQDANQKMTPTAGFDAAGQEVKIHASDWRHEWRESLLYQDMPELPLGAPYRTKTRIFLRKDLRLGEKTQRSAQAGAEPVRSTGGKPRKWNYAQGVNDVWAAIYRNGESDLKTIADVAALLKSKMAKDDGSEPPDTDARAHARMIFHSLKAD